jgi:hypothetical protein
MLNFAVKNLLKREGAKNAKKWEGSKFKKMAFPNVLAFEWTFSGAAHVSRFRDLPYYTGSSPDVLWLRNWTFSPWNRFMAGRGEPCWKRSYAAAAIGGRC